MYKSITQNVFYKIGRQQKKVVIIKYLWSIIKGFIGVQNTILNTIVTRDLHGYTLIIIYTTLPVGTAHRFCVYRKHPLIVINIY